MKILIIGGTYFAGRAFTKLLIEKKEDIFLLNRGSVPVKTEGIVSIKGDRHDTDVIRSHIKALMADGKVPSFFDAVVDFCGYIPGDIKDILGVLDSCGISVGRYVFISTCDVLMHGTRKVLDEDGEIEDRLIEGEAGLYIKGKQKLEEELKGSGCSYTILRPPFLYGPFNYAPRESIYFKWIKSEGQVLFPVDATGKFQMVYTGDLAAAIYNCIKSPKAKDKTFNICGDTVHDYKSFTDALYKATDGAFDIAEITADDCIMGDVPMPFPLHEEESNIYDGSRILDIFNDYTPLYMGLSYCKDFYLG